jgi:hypothetical protein
MISARHTLEQAGHPGPVRDQSNCFVEPCLMQRLSDDVGELEVEFVFGHAAGAVGAGRSGRVAHINEHPKCRSRATAAVPAVQRYGVLSAHRLPSRTGKHHGQCENSMKGSLVDGHGSKLCDAAASRLTRRFVETPRSLCTCFFAVVQTNMTRRSPRRRSKGRNVRDDRGAVLVCQFTRVPRSWRLQNAGRQQQALHGLAPHAGPFP